MLILAGVSLNAIVGENGVLTQAQNATIASRKAEILEKLNLELTKYNIDSFTDVDVGAKEMLAELRTGGYIDEILNSSGYSDNANEALPVPRFDDDNHYTGELIYGVKKEGYGINIFTANDGIYKAEYGEVSFSAGGSVQEGTVLVTGDSFSSATTDAEGNPLPPEDIGKYEITGTSNIIFVDPISGQLSFYVQSGANATINIFNDMTLTNNGISRSAIDIEPGGTLNLYIAKDVTLTVDSGYAEQPSQGAGVVNGYGAVGGNGGFAGIHCWKANAYTGDYDGDGVSDFTAGISSVLNVSGEGTLVCYGGDASDGLGSAGSGDSNTGGGGGGGAGAGIGGKGGQGGTANPNGATQAIGGSADDGEMGEDCGIVNIKDSITVYAYGGAGGSAIGGSAWGAGTGGGGYPAAGIGGGGAGGGGGDHAGGGGGYTGGGGQSQGGNAYNGNAGPICQYGSGAGYFGSGSNSASEATDKREAHIGGQGARTTYYNTFGGDGGVAGKGGEIYISKDATIYAFNGNKYTDETWVTNADGTKRATYVVGHENPSTTPVNQLAISIQDGVVRAVYKHDSYWNSKKYHTYSFLSEILGSSIKSGVSGYAAWSSGTRNTYTIRDASTCTPLTYINPVTNDHYGIGSGAGYIEISNGKYEKKTVTTW